MAQELTEELKVLVTAEVNKAVRNLQKVDKQTNQTEKLFKSLGKTIAGAFTAKAILDFFKKSIAAYEEHTQVLNVLNSTLKVTGATAWTTSAELQDMAAALQKSTNYSADSINQMQSVLLGFKNITGDTFGTATKAILDMATVMGMDLSSAAQAVGKALDDPINGITSLQRQGFRFTDAQKEMIQSLIETGDVAAAQKIILDELNTTYGGAAEAAVKSSAQIKNAFDDVLQGYGKLISDLVGNSGAGNIILRGLNFLSEGLLDFEKNIAQLRGGDNYRKWFDGLDISDKIKESSEQLKLWQIALDKAIADGNSKKIDEAIVNVDDWRRINEELNITQKELQAAQKEENDRIAAENEIYNLMTAINGEYAKLSASDPSIQLENYKKRLSEIASERAKLSSAPSAIDTTAAIKSLDYIEKAFKDKIKQLTADGKKTWREWLSDIQGIQVDLSENGSDAARKLIDSMENEVKKSENISRLLGEKFDAGIFERQQERIRDILEKIFDIDTSKIDEPFTAEDKYVQELIEKYKTLGEAIKDAEDNHNDAKGIETWHDFVKIKVDGLINEFDGLDKKTQTTISNLATNLVEALPSNALSGFETFGEAMAKGADASEALSAALGEMAAQLLSQLPMMFLQAGLQLIAQGQWPIGLGFIAAAGSSALINGYVQGKKNETSAEKNALGNAFGPSGVQAFAMGGAFTNRIVDSPTYFKFAKGSGFATGLMGEAGPEAIMPLSRGTDGRLGVHVDGQTGAAVVAMSVVINNYSQEKVQTQETTDENGNTKLMIMIGNMINSHISGGKADRALSNRYGLVAQGV